MANIFYIPHYIGQRLKYEQHTDSCSLSWSHSIHRFDTDWKSVSTWEFNETEFKSLFDEQDNLLTPIRVAGLAQYVLHTNNDQDSSDEEFLSDDEMHDFSRDIEANLSTYTLRASDETNIKGGILTYMASVTFRYWYDALTKDSKDKWKNKEPPYPRESKDWLIYTGIWTKWSPGEEHRKCLVEWYERSCSRMKFVKLSGIDELVPIFSDNEEGITSANKKEDTTPNDEPLYAVVDILKEIKDEKGEISTRRIPRLKIRDGFRIPGICKVPKGYEDLRCIDVSIISQKIKTKLKISDSDLAKIQLARVKFEDSLIPSANPAQKQGVIEFLDYLNALMFGVETALNAGLLTGLMTLELIKDRKLSYEEAFNVNEDGGRYPYATRGRKATNNKTYSKREILLKNPSLQAMRKDPNLSPVAVKEAMLMKSWLKHKGAADRTYSVQEQLINIAREFDNLMKRYFDD